MQISGIISFAGHWPAWPGPFILFYFWPGLAWPVGIPASTDF